jgi:hypothetical protein
MKEEQGPKATKKQGQSSKHSAASIRDLLLKSDKAVERALVAIYARQTADEKQSHVTKHTNNVGFNKPDSNYCTYLAKWCLKGKSLSGKHLQQGRARVLKYAGQLAAIANAKEAAKVAQKVAA